MGIALLAVAVEVFALFIGRTLGGRSPLDANAALLLAPIIALGGSIFGIRMVFPLSELGSVRTAADLFIFLLACSGLAYFFSKFNGWGIYFFGSFTQLVVVLAVAVFFIWRLWRRALGMQQARHACSLRRGRPETKVRSAREVLPRLFARMEQPRFFGQLRFARDAAGLQLGDRALGDDAGGATHAVSRAQALSCDSRSEISGGATFSAR